MPDYNVTRAIQADRRYEPGEAITLTPDEAKRLVALNAIDPKPVKAAASAADKAAADKAAADKAAADKAAADKAAADKAAADKAAADKAAKP